MNVRSKIWLERDGVLVFGTGKADILRAVASTGSISAAARELGMSYRHAWSALAAVEKRIGRKLLKRAKGGSQGGGAVLTPYAADLLQRFDRLDRSVRAHVDRQFRESFG